ncbi:MAG: hypothetical protein Q8M94_08000 [Ignavibacteria bacterium]|nr:hypothetical protein [Ignavibacteria bacterium]
MEVTKHSKGQTLKLTKEEAIVLEHQLTRIKETGQLCYLTRRPPKVRIEVEIEENNG